MFRGDKTYLHQTLATSVSALVVLVFWFVLFVKMCLNNTFIGGLARRSICLLANFASYVVALH